MQDSTERAKNWRVQLRRYFPIPLWIVGLGVIVWCQTNPAIRNGCPFRRDSWNVIWRLLRER